jgi:hypothetical protein
MADALGFATKGGKSNPKAIANSRGTQTDINAIRKNAGVLGDVIGQGDDASYKQFVQQQQAKPQQQAATKSQSQPKQSLFSKIKTTAIKDAKTVGNTAKKAVIAVGNPGVDLVTGKGGKLAHDSAQLASDVTGGTSSYAGANAANIAKITAAHASGNKAALANAKAASRKNLGLDDNANITKNSLIKLGANAANVALMGQGGVEAKALGAAKKEGASLLGKRVAKDAAIGAGFGTAQTYAQNPNATKKEAFTAAAAGGLLGGTVPVAAKGVAKGMEALHPHTQSALDNIMDKVRPPKSLLDKSKANTELAAAREKETAKAAIEVPKLEQKIELINAKKADGKFSNVDKVKVKQLEEQKKALSTGQTSATATQPQAQLPSGAKPEQTPVPKESSVTSVDNSKNITLPENHVKYFNVENATDTVPLNKLVSSKTPEQNIKGGTNAAKFMDQASKGEIDKRNPITVTPTKDGNYKILDGNGTFTAAQKAGWKDLPVNVVEPKHGEAAQKLVTSAKKINSDFQENLKNFSKGMGYNYISGPVKSLDRVLRKGTTDYEGDFSKIKDSVRGTIVAPEVNRMPAIVEHLKRTFDVVRVKNGYESAKHGDYKDIKVNIRMPDGHITEVIIATPRTIAIKEGRTHKLYEIMQDEKRSKLERGAAKHETYKLYRQSHLADLAESKASASSGDLPYSSSKTLAASEREISRDHVTRLSGTEAPVKTTEASKLSDVSTSRSTTSSSKKNLSLISSNTPTKSIAHSNKSSNSLLDKTKIKPSSEVPKTEAPTSKTPDDHAKLVEEVAQEYPNKEQFIKDTAAQYQSMEEGLKGGQLVADKEQYGQRCYAHL